MKGEKITLRVLAGYELVELTPAGPHPVEHNGSEGWPPFLEVKLLRLQSDFADVLQAYG